MLVHPDSYSLKIKTNKGWKVLPGFYQTAYSAYKNYCETAGIEPIAVDAFYGVFNMLADADFLNTLITAVSGSGVLPISIGGTGGTTAEDARKALNVYSCTELDVTLDALQDQIDTLVEQFTGLNSTVHSLKPADLGINIGEDAPTSETPGTIYFRVD